METDQPVLQERRKSDKDLSVPLTVKCDQDLSNVNMRTPQGSMQSKPYETLSPAIWPTFADLIDDTPQIEDTEIEDNEESQREHYEVTVDRTELERVLSQAVSVTRGCSVLSLMDLYGQLNRVVVKYSRTHERNNLPQELQREITRFQDIQKRPGSSSKTATLTS